MSPSYSACRAVLFDLDGTLIDSFPSHLQAYLSAFTRLGFPVDEARLRAVYAPNWFDTYRALGIPPERWAEADVFWLEEAARHTPALFPGAADLLERLARSRRLGVVTAGSRSRVTRDLKREGILDRFQVLITNDEITRPKPDPEGLNLALLALAVSPAEALYVGDTLPDYEMARAAGVPFIGVPGPVGGLTSALDCPLLNRVSELEGLLED